MIQIWFSWFSCQALTLKAFSPKQKEHKQWRASRRVNTPSQAQLAGSKGPWIELGEKIRGASIPLVSFGILWYPLVAQGIVNMFLFLADMETKWLDHSDTIFFEVTSCVWMETTENNSSILCYIFRNSGKFWIWLCIYAWIYHEQVQNYMYQKCLNTSSEYNICLVQNYKHIWFEHVRTNSLVRIYYTVITICIYSSILP